MKQAGILTKILVFAVIAFLVWTIADSQRRIKVANAQLEGYKDQVAALEVENDELRRRNENWESDEIREEIAREELDLVKPDEEVIKN